MLFNWFKKKDKLIPLEPLDSGPEHRSDREAPFAAGNGREHGATGASATGTHRSGRDSKQAKSVKPFERPVMTGAKKAEPLTKDTIKINTSESAVIRIGKLGEVLLQYNMISRENLEKALAIQQQSFVPSGPQDKSVQKRKLLGEILIEHNFVTEEQLLSAFARHCRIPYIKLNKYGLPKEAIKSVPDDLIVKHRVMPVDKIGSMLMLAVTDPYDTNALEEVKAKTGLRVKAILCKQSEFEEMVKFYYPHLNKKPEETPADVASETVAPNASVKSESQLGEETAVFKIEDLPFPEPPIAQSAPVNQSIEDKSSSQAGITEIAENPPESQPEDIKIKQTAPSRQGGIPEPTTQTAESTSLTEDKKESFLGETIKETAPASLSATANPPKARPANAPQIEGKTEPAPEISPQPLQAQKLESPAQQPAEPTGVNGYDTSLIDIQDLIAAQQNSSDENIEVIPEEPEPIDMAPYIYPTSNAPTEPPSAKALTNRPLAEKEKEPKEIPESSLKTPPEVARPAQTDVRSGGEVKKDKEVPASEVDVTARVAPKEKSALKNKETVRPAAKKAPPPPIPAPLPESGSLENKALEENPVLVSDDEFLVAQQLFTTQLAHSWEKLYYRSKTSRAEKIDESEFVFYTETAVH